MIKDVVALLDGTAGDLVPLGHAERIARMFEATLTALYLNVLPDILISGMSSLSPMALDEAMATSRHVGTAAETRLAARVGALTVPNQLCRVDAASNELWNLVSNASRMADLFVARHPNGRGAPTDSRLVAEAALFGSARGVYLAQQPAAPGPMCQSVVVAWDNSRSATRALTEAVPFLQEAERTFVVTVEDAGAAGPAEIPQDRNLAQHLAHLGINATHLRVNARGRSVSQVLVEEIVYAEADLLVMGAYGHSRVREWIFGSVTRDFLAHSPVPLLMAR